MNHTNLLHADLCRSASVAARVKARRKNTAGLDYLRARIYRELEERWLSDAPDDAPDEDEQSRVLLLDFDGASLRLGDGVTVRQVSLLDSPATPPPDFFAREAGGLDGVIIGVQMAWLEPQAVLTEALRLLRPGGRLLFCTFGPDTLQQLRWAWREVDEFPHIHPFIDMHIIGDELLRCGLNRPIVDVDRVSVEYERADMLYADLRGEGFTNALHERRKTLTGKARRNGFAQALETLREADAPLAITFELIYGAATAPLSSSSQIRVAAPKMA